MKYLVMECGLSWAVVMDEEGRFIKVANLGYEVGQTVDHVIPAETKTAKPRARILSMAAAIAACLCLIVFGAGNMLLSPYGTVRVRINPDVQLSINRFDRVLHAEGMNADGATLLEDFDVSGETVQEATELLADRAVEMGYLKDGMEIHLLVDSTHLTWKTAIEQDLMDRIDRHFKEETSVHPAVLVVLDEALEEGIEDVLEELSELQTGSDEDEDDELDDPDDEDDDVDDPEDEEDDIDDPEDEDDELDDPEDEDDDIDDPEDEDDDIDDPEDEDDDIDEPEDEDDDVDDPDDEDD